VFYGIGIGVEENIDNIVGERRQDGKSDANIPATDVIIDVLRLIT
jgi:hypothetical protein